MKNLVYYISVCCNAHVYTFAQTVQDLLNGTAPTCICKVCNKSCEIEVKPAYEEKSKGIYSKIEYK